LKVFASSIRFDVAGLNWSLEGPDNEADAIYGEQIIGILKEHDLGAKTADPDSQDTG
jgi:hypothetical protein